MIGVALSGAMVWANYLTPDVGLVWYSLLAIYYTLAFQRRWAEGLDREGAEEVE